MTFPPQTQTTDTINSLLRYRKSCQDFSRDAVFTLDNTDKQNPVKRYPIDEKIYLGWCMQQMVDEPLLAVLKHRRLIITWTMCIVFLWDAMFFEGRFNALVSKKEEDSDELVRRCKFVYDNIPTSILPFKPDLRYKYTEITFPEINSTIKGVAQGPDQLRQYTCSRIGGDEMAFWPSARLTFTAMKPTLEGGGKVTLVSTRFPGFFQELVYDMLDAA